LLELAALNEGEGQTRPAIETLQRLLKHDPTHEEAHRRLVALFALSGNLHRARHQYQILKEVLRRELDAEPDPQSQQLFHDILAGRLPGAKPAVERPAAATAVWTSALDETYGALSDQERLAFRRLAIFAGGFSQEAAAMAWGGEIEKGRVPALLTRLSERSLIIPDRHGYEVRYRMLETVRRYARLQLDRAGETDPTLGRHSHWFVSLAERAEAELSRPDQALWLRQLDADRENLRAALEFCREHDPLPGARLAAALWQYWEIRGEPAEGRRWLEEMLARAQPDLPVEPRARMLLGTGTLASRQGDHRGAQPLLEESLRLFEDIGDRWGIAWSLDNLGMLSLSEGNVGEARAMFERSMALFERAGDMRGRACVLDNLGWTALMDGDPAQAQRYFERALVVFREIDDRRGIGRALANLANTLRVQGDLKSARALFAESLPYCQTTPGSRGESRWASFTQFLRRSVLLRLQLFFWSGAAGPIALPCAGVCAGYPLFAHLVSATTVPLWAVVVHLVILPIAVPVNAILLFISFRRHHRP
jgi:tetratricopeptide (TPR) repeat protein